MSRRYANQLGHKEPVDEVFMASGKQLRPNRNGNLYLQIDLSDRSGTIAARMWNANETVYKSFDNGDYVRIEGTAQLFQGAMQVIVTGLTRVDADEVNEDDFTQLASVDVEKLVARMGAILRGMSDPHLRNLAECFLLDDAFMAKFTRAPAGVKHHHAYIGGLMEHIVNLMDVVLRICPCYPQIDRDLLLMGAFIHDVGKVEELTYDRELAYSDEGQLIGHVVIAVRMLNEKVREAERLAGEAIPEETVLRLKHMLVSHHGQYEFGSPRLPMTLEAIALYLLDNLDAKINAFDQLMREDPNVESPWTHYHANLGRKLFKGYEGQEKDR
ncbi:MAG TPA: OB-fold nucleic acid binding domain-containing protein [Thermoguttaceae bacterium]|nr:OB-fold nucleic acid binding domain-containing protein [Thermoguttaceae bacterium]